MNLKEAKEIVENRRQYASGVVYGAKCFLEAIKQTKPLVEALEKILGRCKHSVENQHVWLHTALEFERFIEKTLSEYKKSVGE